MKLRDNLIVGGSTSINIINNAEISNLSALFEKEGIILKRTLGNIVNYNYDDLLNNINYNIPSIFTPGETISKNNPNVKFSMKSQPINTFLAAPSIGNGTPSFRRITAEDLADTGVLFSETDPFGVSSLEFTGTKTKTLTITLNNGSKKTANFDDANSTYPPGTLDLLKSGTDTLDRIWSSKAISDYVNLIFQEGASKDHTHTFASITSKPTTLSGYGITDGGISEVVSNIATGTTDVASTSNGSTFINFLQGGAVRGSVKIVGSGSTSVTHTTGGVITITGTDTNTTYTAGNGLTLSGTVFSLPVTDSGSGDYVTNVTASANGLTVTKATLPIPSLITSTSATGVANVATTNTNTYLNIVRGGTSTGSSTQITGSGSVTVSSDASGKLTINGTNTTYTAGTLTVLNTGTATTQSTWTSAILNDWLNGKNFVTASIIDGLASQTWVSDNFISNTHVANGITTTNISNWNTAFTNNHTHSNKAILDATTASFTTALKTKLDGLSNYTLPTASASVLGGIKVGNNLSIDANGVLSSTNTTPNDGTLTLSTGTGLSGSATFSANQSTNSTFTVGIASTHVLPTTAQTTSWNNKQDAITGGATTIVSSNLTANRALISNASGKVAVSTVTSTQLGYLSGVTSAIQTQLNDKINTSLIGANNGVASLGSDGKINSNQLPALAITETFPVSTQAQMLALTAQQGDVAIRTDINKTFILRQEPASTLANWEEMLMPASGVQSVAMSVPTGFSISGSPITSTGTLALSYASGYQGFTTAQSTKLAGIATGANNYTLPIATATVLGGIELFSNTVQSVAANAVSTTASRTYGLQLNSAGQAVVNVPWTNTVYTGSNGINVNGTVISPTYGTAANTIAQGNDTRINNGQTAFGWGDFRQFGLGSTSIDTLYNTWNKEDLPLPAFHKGTNHGISGISDNLYGITLPSSGYGVHIAGHWTGRAFIKGYSSSVDNGWHELWHSGNFNPSDYALTSQLAGYVPTSRTITINGVTQNLSANRSWTVPDTVTRLRGTASGTYTSGDLTLLAGANTTITQSGSNITIASTNTNTTYSAGTGLSLTGTTFANTAPNATHTGDVTGATALTIANSAVTHAKYQNIATQRILGRGATGTGNVQELTLGANLTLSTAGVLSATNTNTTYTASNGITISGSNVITPTYGTAANTIAQGNHTHATLTRGTGLTGDNYTGAAATTWAVAYGTTAGTAAQGNDSRINNGQTAFGWGRGIRIDGNSEGVHNIMTLDTHLIKNSSIWANYGSANIPNYGSNKGAPIVNFTPYKSGSTEYGFSISARENRILFNTNEASVVGNWLELYHTGNLSTATATVNGLIKLGSNTVNTATAAAVSATASRTYLTQLNSSGQLVVNVPWTNTDTKYTAGTGLSLSGTTFGQTITTSGSGTFVTGITQTTNGFQINLGTPPNTNTTYTGSNGIGVSGTVISPTYGTTSSTIARGDHKHTFLSGWSDTRSVDTIPNDYNSKFEAKGIKQNGVLGLNVTTYGSYTSVIGYRGWSETSGGQAFELGFAGNGQLLYRSGASTSWGAWNEFIHDGNLDSQATTLGFIKSSSLSGYVPTSRTLTAGNGLSGGGNLTANRTFTLGTPSAITLSSTNSVAASSHTHAFTPGGTTAQYIRGDGSLATYVNTTYTAGTGLSLTGTTFGQTITTSGSGTFVTGITQTANGFQINLGTPPNTTYSAGTLALLNTGADTGSRVWSAKVLSDYVDTKVTPVYNVNRRLSTATSYIEYVLVLFEYTTGTTQNNRFFYGELAFNRTNGNGNYRDIVKVYGGSSHNNQPAVAFESTNNALTLVTFKFNNKTYVGVRSTATATHDEIFIKGFASNPDHITVERFRNNNTNAVLNAEINDSIALHTVVNKVKSLNYSIESSANITADKFIKTGGTSTQFLKADGSVDTNNYALASALSGYVPYTGATANVNLGARSITSTGGFIGNASTATKLASITTTFTGTYPVTFNVNGTIYSHAGLTYTGSTGALAATTFIGALTGNASTATTLATARTINGTSFNGSANITTANWGTSRSIGVVNSDGSGTAVTTSVNGSSNVNLKLPATIKASLTGNATTATTLATARTINGTSFNGSANIVTSYWGTARNITIGNTTKSVNGSGNVSWSLAEIGAVSQSSLGNYLPLAGGTMGNTATIHWSGADYTTGIIHKHRNVTSGGFALARMSTDTHDKGFGISTTGDFVFGDWSGIANLSTSWNTIWHSGNFNPAEYVPTSRRLTINGVTQNLSANRSWTVPDTVTRLRGTASGTYTSGDLTLLAGANTTITQSGANITIASTNTNTTYSAGNGLTLSGTAFSLPVTVSGSGNYVSDVTQTTNGITVTKSTLPSLSGYVPYTGASASVNTGNHTITGGALGVTNTSNTTGLGLSLYGGATTGLPTYGIAFSGTTAFGKHGGVTGDWATYFTMTGATTRGWIFRHGTANIASISSTGIATFNNLAGTGNRMVIANSVGTLSTQTIPTNTTYSAGTGLSLSGTTFSVKYGTTAGTAAQGNDSRIVNAVPNTRTITAGTGLTGGGSLSANRTINFDTAWGDNRYLSINGTAKEAETIKGITTSITITGDANTYYPVVISGTARKTLPTFVSIWKNLNSVTNSTYSGNHSNKTSSLWLQYETRVTTWDGNGGYHKTLYKTEPYATLVADTNSLGGSSGALTVWLRGGGTQYNITVDNPSVDINVYYTSTQVDTGATVAPRTTIGNGGIYWSTPYGYGTFSGNASTATTLATARTINGTSFNGSANITTANWGTARSIGVVNSDGSGTAVTTSVNGSSNVNLKLPATIKASLTGNATTATTLATARTINGTSFNGSANIVTSYWGTARNITIGNTTKSVNGSGNVSWSLSEIGAASQSSLGNYLPLAGGTVTGNVGIGITPTAKLDVNGTVRFRNFSNTLLSTDSNGNLSNVANLILENKVLRPSIDTEISLGSPTKRWVNFYNIGTIMSIGNSHFGIRAGDGYTTAALLKATTITYGGDLEIGSESNIKFKNTTSRILNSSGGILLDFLNSDLTLGNTSLNKVSLKCAYGSVILDDKGLQVSTPVAAQSFYESSLRRFKTNIKSFTKSGLDIINELEIVTFDRNDSNIKNKIGIIADDSHEDVLNEEKTAVDLYKTIFIQAKAIQELDKNNKTLEERINQLERIIKEFL